MYEVDEVAMSIAIRNNFSALAAPVGKFVVIVVLVTAAPVSTESIAFTPAVKLPSKITLDKSTTATINVVVTVPASALTPYISIFDVVEFHAILKPNPEPDTTSKVPELTQDAPPFPRLVWKNNSTLSLNFLFLAQLGDTNPGPTANCALAGPEVVAVNLISLLVTATHPEVTNLSRFYKYVE